MALLSLMRFCTQQARVGTKAVPQAAPVPRAVPGKELPSEQDLVSTTYWNMKQQGKQHLVHVQ